MVQGWSGNGQSVYVQIVSGSSYLMYIYIYLWNTNLTTFYGQSILLLFTLLHLHDCLPAGAKAAASRVILLSSSADSSCPLWEQASSWQRNLLIIGILDHICKITSHLSLMRLTKIAQMPQFALTHRNTLKQMETEHKIKWLLVLLLWNITTR